MNELGKKLHKHLAETKTLPEKEDLNEFINDLKRMIWNGTKRH